jgi:hypothetical protein
MFPSNHSPVEQAVRRHRRQSRKSPDEIPPGASPLTGVVPPPEHRWRPGQSGNPRGRPRAAGSVRDQLNAMVSAGLTEDQVRRIFRNSRSRWPRRAAALILLRLVESGDVADFEPLLSGETTLEQLRKSGVNTEVVKRFRQGKRTASIELHDRSREAFKFIMDRTEGRPARAPTVGAESGIPTSVHMILP